MIEDNAVETRDLVLNRLTMTIHDWPWARDDWYHIEDLHTFLLWGGLLLGLLVVGVIYVIWMYVRDGSTIGKGWGVLLAFLRLTVYAIIAIVFLLPAFQKGSDTKQQSKVVILGDISQSMDRRDAPLDVGVDPDSRPTRKDDILRLLGDTDNPDGFIKRLEKNNPITFYRFGGTLDENYWVVDQQGRVRDRKSLEETKLSEGEVLSRSYLTEMLKPNKEAPGLSEEQKNTLKNLVKSTNVGGAVQAVMMKERNNMPQGIILFSDCRSNSGSAAAALATVADEAKRAKIPVFVVIVGEDRPDVKMEIADLRGPDWVRPEDPFRVTVDVSAKGLGNHTAEVALDVYPPGKDPKTDPPALTLPLRTKEDPEKKVKFQRNDLSVEQVEFEIYPKILEAIGGAKPEEKPPDKPKPGGKPEESGPAKPKLQNGEWKFVPRVTRDEAEGHGDPFHTRDPLVVRVEDKPLRVLLMASAPTRDYQFVRTMLVREFDKHRLDLAIYLQPLPNQAGNGPRQHRNGIVQDVPDERLLRHFPDKFLAKAEEKKNPTPEDEKKNKGEAFYNLANYDVIVAFDPDWSDDTIDTEKLDTWVAQQGGGLVVVAGPINTLELARNWMKIKDHILNDEDKAAFIKRDANGNYRNPLGRYVRILDMYPVQLKDSRLEKDRNTAEPAGLRFEDTQEMDFLKLDEENPKSAVTSAWNEFFARGKGKDNQPGTGKVSRGFYGYYPVAKAKGRTVARFVDDSSEKKTEAPYLVVQPNYGTGRVIWLGSGETWRLRQFKEVWHERLWTKLVRYAGQASLGTSATRRIIPEVGNRFPAGSKIKVTAKLLGKDLKPLKPKEGSPKVVVRPPAGVVGLEPEYPMKPEMIGGSTTDDNGDEEKQPTGRFVAEFPADMPGKYSIDIQLDNEPPSTHVIDVYQEDAEQQDPSPDWAAAYALASDADDVLAHIEDRQKAAELEKKLHETLQRYKAIPTKEGEQPAADKAKGDKDKKKEEKLRLVFTLDKAGIIPDCMLKHENVQHTKGKPDDLWDAGFPIPFFGWRFSYVLLVVVLLLGTEWLIRKLLRLA